MDFASDDARDVPVVVPDRGTPRTIGILNIIFGGLLLLCGACYGAYSPMLVAMMPAMQAQQRQAMASMQAAQQNLRDAQDRRIARDEVSAVGLGATSGPASALAMAPALVRTLEDEQQRLAN